MLWTLVRKSSTLTPSQSVTKSIRSILPLSALPPSLAVRPGNLYEVLSRTPSGGIGKKVHQVRWGEKGIADSYWKITRARFKSAGKHGKAWGLLHWKGKLVSPHEELIRGALKYTWTEGSSTIKS